MNHAPTTSGTVPLNPVKRQSKSRVITAITIGNALEFFDFTVYAAFALVISKIFFPHEDEYVSLMLTVATFGVGFIMRPLGGLVLGLYADIAGRKAAMTMTIMLMAVGCLMIGLAPTYAQVGYVGTAIVVIARLLQGFSAGGEVGASTSALIEQGHAKNRGFLGSWQFASQGLGVGLGALFAFVLTSMLSQEALYSWGWRVPFLFGALIAPVGFYIRRHLEETHAVATSQEKSGKRKTMGEMLKNSWREAMVGTVLTIGGTVTAYTLAFYMPIYAVRELGLPPAASAFSGVVVGLIMFAASPIGGLLSDRFSRKRIILMGRLFLIVATYPFFLWLNADPSVTRLLICVSVLTVFFALNNAPAITSVPEMFPRAIRATGMSFVYSVAVALFGGFLQNIVTWLIHTTGNKLAPAMYMVAMLCISSIAVYFMRDTTGQELDEE